MNEGEIVRCSKCNQSLGAEIDNKSLQSDVEKKRKLIEKLDMSNEKLSYQLVKAENSLKFVYEVAKNNPAGYYETDEEIDGESPEDITCANAGVIIRDVDKYFAEKEESK